MSGTIPITGSSWTSTPSNQAFFFEAEILEAVGSCQVLIAVIGSQWLKMVDNEGCRRLDNPEDFVRIELETALDSWNRMLRPRQVAMQVTRQ